MLGLQAISWANLKALQGYFSQLQHWWICNKVKLLEDLDFFFYFFYKYKGHPSVLKVFELLIQNMQATATNQMGRCDPSSQKKRRRKRKKGKQVIN